jgi:signal transduction histidine kinase
MQRKSNVKKQIMIRTPKPASVSKRNRREQNILLEISTNIISTLDYEKVLQIISDGMSDLLEIETAAIYLIEGENELYLGATTPPLPPDFPEYLRRFPVVDHFHIQKTILSRTSKFILDTSLETLTPAEQEIVAVRKLRSLLYFPFIKEDHVIGVLILGTSNKTRNFSKEEIELGQTVANQLSIGIQNARLHHDLKMKNEELKNEIQVRMAIAHELKNHRDNLEKLVNEKTRALDETIEVLKTTNDELYLKNDTIEKQNIELRETLKDLREAQSKLIHAEKMASLGVLTAGVAHEINNPLNYITGAYEGIKNYLHEDNGNLQHTHVPALLDALKSGLDRVQNIVKSLNQFSRDDKIKTEECKIDQIIDNCLTILYYQLKDRIEVEKKYQELADAVQGNVGNLHQVFLNILTNAIQAIDGHGTIAISVMQVNDTIVTEIKDSGIGVQKGDLAKLTDPFFTTKAPGLGTGLGLSIAYKIIKAHGGTIEFNSEVGQGTTVHVILPVMD